MQSITSIRASVSENVTTLNIDSLKTPTQEFSSGLEKLTYHCCKDLLQKMFRYTGAYLPSLLRSSEHFIHSIPRLKKLHTVRWQYQTNANPSWVIEPVTNALAALPELRHLELDLWSYDEEDAVPGTSRFSGLESFKLTWQSNKIKSYVEKEVVPMILSSPNLQNFELVNEGYDYRPLDHQQKTGHYPDLYTLFGPRMDSTPGTRMGLKHLGLTGIPIQRLDELLLEVVFSGLESLAVSRNYGEGKSIDWALLWGTLQGRGIHLKALETNTNDMETLLPYLASFSGLKKLILYVDGSDADAARRFWEEVLPRHITTLRVLQVSPTLEGDWCYGSAASRVIINGMQLERLGFSVCQQPPEWKPVQRWKNLVDAEKAWKSSILLLNDSAQLPKIHTLDISIADLESDRGAECGTGIIERRDAISQKMVKAITGQFKPTERHPQTVLLEGLGKGEVITKEQLNEGEFRYKQRRKADMHDEL